VSWAVEAGAVAAGWWHWTVPVRWPLLGNVPFIGLVDWFFVGTDFLLPFLALTSPSLRRARWRWATLAAFPLHFAAHLAVERPSPWWPVPLHHVAHWLLLAFVLAAAARSRHTDEAFSSPAGRARRFPVLALGVIAVDLALVETLVVGRPALLATLLPAAGVAAIALQPKWGRGLAAAGVVGAPFAPSLALAAVPAAVDFGLRRLQRAGRGGTIVAVAALSLLAGSLHHRAALAERDLLARLDRAIAARDRGDLEVAERELEAAAERHRGAHAPSYLLGELRYRTGRPDEAARTLANALAVKPDHLPAFRLRTVALLRAARTEAALETARRGLRVAPSDVELRYLERRASGADVTTWPELERLDPAAAERVAAIAFEVGDVAGAATLLDRALAHGPERRDLYSKRTRLALAMGDRAAAERVLAHWRRRFPDDPELARASAALGQPAP
jgi:tetratricopeptide (TPR) repeat protein